jgi:hypothetical protein
LGTVAAWHDEDGHAGEITLMLVFVGRKPATCFSIGLIKNSVFLI